MPNLFNEGISELVLTYAKEYQEKPEYMIGVLEKFDSPLSVIEVMYNSLTQDSLPKIEDLEEHEKLILWNLTKGTTEKRIKMCRAIYLLEKIINE